MVTAMREITYQSETDREYARALSDADTLEALKQALRDFQPFVGDAEEVVASWDETTFKDWRKGLYMERHGRFMGKKRAGAGYGTVLMPGVLLQVTILASKAFVPWGAAYIQMREAGVIKNQNGHDFIDRGQS